MIRLVDKNNNYILGVDNEPLEFEREDQMLTFMRTLMSNIQDEIDLITRGIYIEKD